MTRWYWRICRFICGDISWVDDGGMVMPRLGARNSRVGARNSRAGARVVRAAGACSRAGARNSPVGGRVGVLNSWAGAPVAARCSPPGAATPRAAEGPRGATSTPDGPAPLWPVTPGASPLGPATPAVPRLTAGCAWGVTPLGISWLRAGHVGGSSHRTGLGQAPPRRGRIRNPLGLKSAVFSHRARDGVPDPGAPALHR